MSDDLALEGTRSFADPSGATDDEVIVFGWPEFESHAALDLANERVAADPEMAERVEHSNAGFDAAQMAYGRFPSCVRSSGGRDA